MLSTGPTPSSFGTSFAQTAKLFFKDGVLSNRVSALRNSVVEAYILSKHKTHCIKEPKLTCRFGDFAFHEMLPQHTSHVA